MSRRILKPTGDELPAIDGLERALVDHVFPMIKAWFMAGPHPRPGTDEVEFDRAPLDKPYVWLPVLLSRLKDSIRFNSRNYVNIHPSPYVPGMAASLAVSLQNPNNIVPAVSKATSKMETEVIAWMAGNLAGFQEEGGDKPAGTVVSGGTIANITALLVARDYSYRKLARPRPSEVRQRGLFGRREGVVMATAGSHYSVKKALWVLGLGDENVVLIPVAYDEEMRQKEHLDANFERGIRRDGWPAVRGTHDEGGWHSKVAQTLAADRSKGEEELRSFYDGEDYAFSLAPLESSIYKALYGCFEYDTPLLGYVFTIGTTDTGTIECPSEEVINKLLDEDVYIHADAAAGGFALVHPAVEERVRRDKVLRFVHSMTIDGHKLGQLPYPSGAILFRQSSWVAEIMHEAPYLEALAPTLEGSRPGSHVAALWAATEDLGVDGYRAWMDRLFGFMSALKEAFEKSDRFQILHEVHLTTIAIAPRPKDGESRTTINKRVARLHKVIDEATDSDAWLVNKDDSLSGVKVADENCFKPGPDHREQVLVDIVCLRIVACNPTVEPSDARGLVSWLERMLDKVEAEERQEREQQGQRA